MRAEVIDASPRQRVLPRLRVRVHERSAPEREYIVTMLANLFVEHCDGFVIQRYSDRGTAFGASPWRASALNSLPRSCAMLPTSRTRPALATATPIVFVVHDSCGDPRRPPTASGGLCTARFRE